MPLIVKQQDVDKGFLAEAIADLPMQHQFELIAAELQKPKRSETIRRKLAAYWPQIEEWQETAPELFDAIFYVFVAEVEARHASAPDGIGHLRDIASTV